MIQTFEGKDHAIQHVPGPMGVRGRNSDNDLIQDVLGWQPSISLRTGLQATYNWIKNQIDQERDVQQDSYKTSVVFQTNIKPIE